MSGSLQVRTIEEPELRAAIDAAIAVHAIREAFRADGEGRAHVPSVINLEVPAARGEFHIKTAFIEGIPRIAVKVASGFYDNPAKGLPTVTGVFGSALPSRSVAPTTVPPRIPPPASRYENP